MSIKANSSENLWKQELKCQHFQHLPTLISGFCRYTSTVWSACLFHGLLLLMHFTQLCSLLSRCRDSEGSLCTSSTSSRTSETFLQLSATKERSIISWAISVMWIFVSSGHLWMVYHDLKAASRTAFSSFLRVCTCSMKSWNRNTMSLQAWFAYEDIMWWWSRPTTGSVPESISASTNCSAETTPRDAGSLGAHYTTVFQGPSLNSKVVVLGAYLDRSLNQEIWCNSQTALIQTVFYAVQLCVSVWWERNRRLYDIIPTNKRQERPKASCYWHFLAIVTGVLDLDSDWSFQIRIKSVILSAFPKKNTCDPNHCWFLIIAKCIKMSRTQAVQ